MLLTLLLCVLVSLALASDLSPYCRLKLPFTGYKFMLELHHGMHYVLVYCHDNKLMFKSTIDTLNHNFTFGSNNLTIMKTSTSILPNRLLGSLLVNNEYLAPMLSDNLLKSWIEVNDRFERIVHIPVLTTPQVDSRYHVVGR